MDSSLRISVLVNAAGAQTALRSLKQSMRDFRREMELQQLTQTGRTFRDFRLQLAGLRGALAITAAEWGGLMERTKTGLAPVKGLSKFETGLARVTGHMNKFGFAAKSVGAIVGTLGNAITGVGRDIQWLGRQLEFRITLPLLLLGGVATNFALQNERAFTRIRKVYGGAGDAIGSFDDDLGRLRQAFRGMSDTYGVAQNEVLEVGAAWAQAGAQGRFLAEAVQLTIQTAILGEIELGAATEGLLVIQQAYSLTIEELVGAIATLNQIENETTASLPDLIEVFQDAAGAARLTGTSIQELGALTAAMIPVAGDASEVGNALKTIMARIVAPTNQAAEAFARVGVDVKSAEFAAAGLIDKLFQLSRGYGDLSDAQQQQFVRDVFQLRQFSRASILIQDLLNQYSRYNSAIEATADQTANMNKFNDELMAFLESSPQKVQILKTRIQNQLADFGVQLLPIFTTVLTAIENLVRKFNELDESTKKAVVRWAILVAVVGPIIGILGAVIIFVGLVVRSFAFMIKAIVDLYGVIGMLTVQIAKNAAGLAIWASQHRLVAAQIGVLVVAALVLDRVLKDLFGTSLTSVIQGFGQFLIDSFTNFLRFMGDVARGFNFVIQSIADGISALPRIFAAALNAVIRIVARAAEVIYAGLQRLNPFARFSPSLVEQVKSGTKAIVQTYEETYQKVRYANHKNRNKTRGGKNQPKTSGTGSGPLEELNPWTKHSPSLVEQVASGVDAIISEYSRAEGLVTLFSGAANALDEFNQATAAARARMDFNELMEARQNVLNAAPGAGPAFDALIASVVELRHEATALTGAITQQEIVVQKWERAVKTADLAVEAARDQLESLRDAADAVQDTIGGLQEQADAVQAVIRGLSDEASRLTAAISASEGKIRELASTPITGMTAMRDEIFANEQAQKALRLEILKLEEAQEEIEDTTDSLAKLSGEIEMLRGRREDLRLAGAGSDILSVLDSRIGELDAARREIMDNAGQADGINSQVSELQKQLDELTKQGQIMQLEFDIQFDPLLREIQRIADPIEEMTFDAIVAGIQAEQAAIADYESQLESVNAQMAVYEEQLAGINQEIAYWEEQLEGINDQIKAQEDAIEAAIDVRDGIQAGLEAEQEVLAELETAYNDVEAAIRDAESAVSDFTSAAAAADAAGGAGGGGGAGEGIEGIGDIPDVSGGFTGFGAAGFSEEDLNQMLDEMLQRNVIDEVDWDEIFGGFESAINDAKAALGRLREGFDELIPTVVGFGTVLLGLKWFAVSGGIGNVLQKLNLLPTAIGVIGLKLATAVGAIGLKLAPLAAGVKTAIAAIGAVLAGPVGIAIAVAAVVAGLVWAYNNVEWFRDAVDAVVAFIIEKFAGMVEFFAGIGSAIGDAFGDVAGIISDAFTGAVDLVTGIADDIASVFGGIAGTVGGAAGAAEEVVGGIVLAFEELGGLLAPVFAALGELFAPIIDELSEWGPLFSDIGRIVGEVAQAFGDFFTNLWDQLGKLDQLMSGTIGAVFSDLAVVFSGASEALSNFFGNFLPQLGQLGEMLWSIFGRNPFGPLIDFLASVGAGIVAVMAFLAPAIAPVALLFATFANEIWRFVQFVAGSLGPAVEGIATIFTERLLPVLQWISERFMGFVMFVAPMVTGFFEGLGMLINTVFTLAVETVANALELIRGVFEVFVALFTGDWDGLWEGVLTIVSAVWDNLVALWQAFIDTYMAAWTMFKDAFLGAWGILWGAVQGAVLPIWDALQAAWNGLVSGIRAVWDGFASAFMAVWGPTWTTITGVATSAWEGLRLVWDTIWAAIENTMNFYFGILRGAFDTVTGAILGVWEGFTGRIEGAMNGAQTVLQTFVTWIQGTFQGAITGVGDVIGGAFDGIAGLFSTAWNGAKTSVGSAANLLIGVVNRFIDAINIIPYVDIRPVPTINYADGGVVGGRPGLPAFASGGTMPYQEVNGGFYTAGARAVVGEGSKTHREFVIPTDPKHRNRARSLFAMLATDLYASGGTLNRTPHYGFGIPGLPITIPTPSDVIDGVTDVGAWVVDQAKRVYVAAVNAAAGIARGALSAVPAGPHNIIGGAKNRVIDKLVEWALRLVGSDAGVKETMQPVIGRLERERADREAAAAAAAAAAATMQHVTRFNEALFEDIGPVQRPPDPLGGAPRFNDRMFLEDGGLVRGGRGGVDARIGEGSDDELVLPLTDKILNRVGGGENREIHFHGDLSFPNIEKGTDAREFIENLSALIDDKVRR